MQRLFTIGFTKKSAEAFFTRLQAAGVKRVVDIRLNNSSQLAGFAKKDDLTYFLRAIGGIDYVHVPELAPTAEIMEGFKKKTLTWEAFKSGFEDLLKERKADRLLAATLRDGDCLLCSEHKPALCHRRLVAELFQKRHKGVEVEDL